MPLYEYICPDGHTEEKLVRMDAPNPVCAICGQPTTRTVARTSFILNGDGWYRDGYQKGGGRGDE
jgi:putative FmdB family regulatory protein